jgi:hypothetical protein
MSSTNSFRGAMTLLADSITATAASLWPWSAASIEARRIAADGYAPGQLADVYYLVSFDDGAPESALAALRAAGFTVREPAPPSGFLTVKAHIRIAPYDLTIASARLDHIAEQFGAFATLIGAGRTTNDEAGRAAPVHSRRAIAI